MYGWSAGADFICDFVTGQPDRDTAIRYARQGVDAYLRKPFTPDALNKAIADAQHERMLHGVEKMLEQRTVRLREAERTFRELYEKAPLGYHCLGPDGTILSMNSTELQWLGYAAEEIVGRLTDEWVTEPCLVRIDENTAQIDGLMRIDEVNSELGTSLPENDSYDTIAGFVLCQLRRIPEEGEILSRDNCELTIQEMKGPKIEKLLIKKG